MAIKTVTVTGQLYRPDGTPAAFARGTARLSRNEVDDGLVVPSVVLIAADESGAFAVELWPNERGSGGSEYRVEITSGSSLLLNATLVIPDVEGPITIQDVINAAPYPPLDSAQQAVMQAQAAVIEAKGYRDEAAGLLDGTNTRLDDMENLLQVLRFGDGPYPVFEQYFIGPKP